MKPGQPGKQWTEEETLILRNKIRTIWADPKKHYNDLTAEEVYDPTDVFNATEMCSHPGCISFMAGTHGEKKPGQLAFTPRKALRLTFHDCLKYESEPQGPGMGCDGCLNFDENLEGNNGLQHTVAILVSIVHSM